MNGPNVQYMDEKQIERRLRAAAELQGYKFFDVKLTRSASQAVKVWGVTDLRCSVQTAMKQGEETEFHFYEDGGQAKFHYDDDRFGFYAKIYDDPKGHNRQFFASCYADGDYQILDKEVKEDIEARAKKLMEELKEEVDAQKQELEEKLQPEVKPVLSPSAVSDIVAPVGGEAKRRGFKRKEVA